MTDPAAEAAVIARAQRMVDDAKAQGVRIPDQIKPSIKGNTPSDSGAVVALREAADLVRSVANTRPNSVARLEAVNRFWKRDGSIRAGHLEAVMGERRAEGEGKMRRGTGEDVEPESKAGRAVQLESGTERTAEGVTRQKAVTRQMSPDEKARLIREAQERYGTKGEPKVEKGAPAEAPVKRQKEAERVDLNPTEGQKIAGNYKKGHRSVEGLDYTIENPKGAIRSGTTEDGRPWQVKMPADYGYLRRTEGADGDHIDAYDLKHGDRHFIIDQLNHKTGEFDEHKVILRAKGELDALDTYHRSFSDGRGYERVGNVHEVNTAELKDWLSKADTTRPATEHIFGEDRTYEPPKEKGVSDTLHTPSGEAIKPIRSDYLSNELDRIDFDRFEGIPGALAKFFKSRLQKLAERKRDHGALGNPREHGQVDT